MNHLIDIDERWKAIISATVVIIVNVAALCGFDIGDGMNIQNALLAIAAVASWLWAIWKNHNFTDSAIESQKVLNTLKSIKRVTGEQLTAEAAVELEGGVDYDHE